MKVLGLVASPVVDRGQADVNTLHRRRAHCRLVDPHLAAAAVGTYKDEERLGKKRGQGRGLSDKDRKESE